MRIACGLAIAIGLSTAGAGAMPRQDPAGAVTDPQAEKPATGVAPAPDKGATGPSPGSTTHAAEAPSTPKLATNRSRGKPKRHKQTSPAPADGPPKVIVRQGGASEPAAQIAPGFTPSEAVRQRQSVERLLAAADDQLQMLGARPLDANRQETVGQIHNYMDQARLALKEGDLRRANTLAEKAHLLSDDLVKR